MFFSDKNAIFAYDKQHSAIVLLSISHCLSEEHDR